MLTEAPTCAIDAAAFSKLARAAAESPAT